MDISHQTSKHRVAARERNANSEQAAQRLSSITVQQARLQSARSQAPEGFAPSWFFRIESPAADRQVRQSLRLIFRSTLLVPLRYKQQESSRYFARLMVVILLNVVTAYINSPFGIQKTKYWGCRLGSIGVKVLMGTAAGNASRTWLMMYTRVTDHLGM